MGTCLPKSNLCDNVVDCFGAEDETNGSTTIPSVFTTMSPSMTSTVPIIFDRHSLVKREFDDEEECDYANMNYENKYLTEYVNIYMISVWCLSRLSMYSSFNK